MIKLVDVIQSKNGRKKIEFFQLGIYDLLKNHLGFRYIKINKKGYYLRLKEQGHFEVVNFLELSEAFRDYVNSEFENIEEFKGLNYKEFINEFYAKRPIRNGNYCREYLSEDFELSADNLHRILMVIDIQYREKSRMNEMLRFLNREKFIETIDEIGNFASKKPLFYKRLYSGVFLIFNQPYIKKNTTNITFDFWVVKSEKESQFLHRKLDHTNLISLKRGFDLGRDIEIYNDIRSVVGFFF